MADLEKLLEGLPLAVVALKKQNKDASKKAEEDRAKEYEVLMATRDAQESATTEGKAARKKMNSELAKQNTLYSKIQAIVDDERLATDVGKALVNAVMKTEMQEQFSEIKQKKYFAVDRKPLHFGFALVTAMGEVEGKRITGAASTASFKSDPTMQQTIANLYGALKKNYTITLDTVKTDKAKAKDEPPAKLFFVVVIGNVDLLKLEVRYKGSFSPSPQFLGGVTKTFMKKLNETDVKEQYKFEKACNK